MSDHQYVDDAPFGAPPGVSLHYCIVVSTTVALLTETIDLVTSEAHIVPSYLETGAPEDARRWPRAVYLGAVNPAADVWMTWDGGDPVVGTTAPLGVKLPPTYPSLRVPIPAAIKAGTLKLISDQAAGTPVILTYEF